MSFTSSYSRNSPISRFQGVDLIQLTRKFLAEGTLPSHPRPARRRYSAVSIWLSGMPRMGRQGHMMKIMLAIAHTEGDGALFFEEMEAFMRR